MTTFGAPVWTTEGNGTLSLPPSEVCGTEHGSRWSPYDFNGGTVLAAAGNDFVVVAADTRLSTGYSILSRKESKITPLSSQTILGACGSFNDVIELRSKLKIRAQMYQHDHGSQPSTESLAQLLSNTLYYRRFFPLYSFCLLVGLDKDGKGAVYGYDALGSHQRISRGAAGSGETLMMPLLDNLIEHGMRKDPKIEFSQEQMIALMKDAFISAGERDIYTGDMVEIYIIDKNGIRQEQFNLKKD